MATLGPTLIVFGWGSGCQTDSHPSSRLPDIPHMWTAPSLQGILQCFDQIACVHMSGLFVRSNMNAGQDGFRDESSKQMGDLIEGHWEMRNLSRHGSIDHRSEERRVG